MLNKFVYSFSYIIYDIKKYLISIGSAKILQFRIKIPLKQLGNCLQTILK